MKKNKSDKPEINITGNKYNKISRDNILVVS